MWLKAELCFTSW